MRLSLILLFLAAPSLAYANDMQPPQSVEEPDAPDEDMPPQEPSPAVMAPVPPRPDVMPPANAGVEGDSNYEGVVLQGLNKVTARAETIQAPIGSVVRFGTIEIVAHKCWKSAPDERPENAALIEISEIKQGEAPAQIFLGWMFSSSPGLSALEHPFYDITVVKCEKPEIAKPAAIAPLAKPAKKNSL